MFKRNLGYKLLALIISMVIWYYANQGQNPRIAKAIDLGLDFRMVNSDCVVTDAPRSVKVTLEGARTHIESLASEPDAIAAYINLRGKTPGRLILPVVVRLPEGFVGMVTATPDPKEVPVSLEDKVHRNSTVDVQFIGSPPVGYRFSKPSVSPNRVLISGTARQISRVSQVVLPVDAKAANDGSIDDNFLVAALDATGKAVEGLEISPDKVHLRLDLVEAPASRVVFISPDVVGQPAFPCKVVGIEVEPQTVSVTGRPEKLMDVTTVRTRPVSIAGHSKTFSQPVQVVAPDGLALVKSDSVRVTVRIEESGSGN